jgi:DNA polymerase-3 subunit gamma/tau
MGRKSFYPEIAASAAAFSREGGKGTKMLFSRSLRKLLSRFSPVLWENDQKLGKIRGAISSLEEELEEFENLVFSENGESEEEIKTLCGSLVKQAVKLEAEGTGEPVPIARIRRAAYWSRLAPLGKHKCIIIENAEYMHEGAKNSLLKILEEPPPRVTILLTSSQPRGLLPTMLSRLRVYHFTQRSPQEEAEVLRRIFRKNDDNSGGIGAYLESFLPVSGETFYPLGAYFAASVAAASVRVLQRKNRPLSRALVDLGKFAAPIADKGGFGRPQGDLKTSIGVVLKTADNFEIPGLLAQYYKSILKVLSAWLRNGEGYPEKTRYADLWKEKLSKAFSASDLYNIKALMVFEGLGEELKNAMAGEQ